ncbi:hypothetical protein [Streptomyces sp. NPDC093089]|uniref:hypothetical protein n=1 Tax=Streptomyces sp. NPDC093089 TaxID=3366024 RepID=UPI0038065200
MPIGTATVALPDGKPVQAGKLPVKVARVDRSPADPVEVAVAGKDKGKALGVAGPVVTLTDTATGARTGARTGTPARKREVKVALDLKTLQGAAWSDRARLVALPACALTTPHRAACRKQTPVPSTVDPRTGVLTARVAIPASAAPAPAAPAPAAGVLLAPAAAGAGEYVQAPAPAPTAMVLAAAPTSGGAMGDYAASPLSPSMAWGAGTNMGNFTYSYPIQAPAALGGSAPKVALSYDSSSADGKTSAQNAQASWIGEGWGYEPGDLAPESWTRVMRLASK